MLYGTGVNAMLVVCEQQERFRTYCTLLHMRFCMPPSSYGVGSLTRSASAVGTAEEQTRDSEPRTSPSRSSSLATTDARRTASDRYSYCAAISQQSDDWLACYATPAADRLWLDAVSEAYFQLVECVGRAPSCPEFPEIPEISQLSWNCPEINSCPEILLIWSECPDMDLCYAVTTLILQVMTTFMLLTLSFK